MLKYDFFTAVVFVVIWELSHRLQHSTSALTLRHPQLCYRKNSQYIYSVLDASLMSGLVWRKRLPKADVTTEVRVGFLQFINGSTS